jgi:hypothetical protein
VPTRDWNSTLLCFANYEKQPRPAGRLARQLVFTVVTIVISLFASDVSACQCREREPPCAQYGSADVVFVGSVVRFSSPALDSPEKIDFSIERAIKGLSGSTVQLVSYRTSCDYPFAKGKTYLEIAYRNNERNELYTHYCTRTTELSNASSDLAFFRLFPEKRQSVQILGVLADNDKRLRAVRIVASNGDRNYRTTTNKEGWFSLNVARPGKYRVRILLPLYADVVGTETELHQIVRRVRTRTAIIIEYDAVVEPNRCAFVNPPLFIDYLEYKKHRD